MKNHRIFVKIGESQAFSLHSTVCNALKNSNKNSKKKRNFCWTTIIFILVIGAILIFLVYNFDKTVTEGSIEDKCLEIQNSPDMIFPCKCFPTVKEIDESDYVESKTSNFCTCVCDIGNNMTYTMLE